MVKLVNFYPNGEENYSHFGVLAGDKVIEMGESDKGTLISWLLKEASRLDAISEMAESVALGLTSKIMMYGHERQMLQLADMRLCSPLNPPASLRDFYAFEQHVKTSNENRGRDVPPEWYNLPVFYFSNTSELFGHDEDVTCPAYTEKLDFELEVAAVIGKAGRNIKPEEAEDYIFGYMIFNDWSARDVQAREMSVGLGPAKGKDFAQSFGPYLVTPDELADKHAGRPGVYDLAMIARINGKEVSRGNWKDIHWSFGDMLARASDSVTLQPGDVIGSGTVGTGCLHELTRAKGPWLQSGDVVELEIERLGVLRNKII
jgi:2-keto-4-pentenoate hydratase/2-oxohepta-3-ene-1,7-dioic acid hydratase in catechol pathway